MFKLGDINNKRSEFSCFQNLQIKSGFLVKILVQGLHHHKGIRKLEFEAIIRERKKQIIQIDRKMAFFV